MDGELELQLPTTAPHDTVGILFVGFALSAVIYGVTCIQTARYFRLYCKGDNWLLKSAVISVWIIETVVTCFTMHGMFYYAIQSKGDFTALWMIPWTISIQSAFNTLSGMIVQFFFAWRIFILSARNYWHTSFICSMSVAQFAMGTSVSILWLGTSEQNIKVLKILVPSFALTAATDIVICASLCYYLHARKTGIAATNTLVNKLIVLTINNGIFSCSMALLALIALYTLPMTQLATACCFLYGKAYINTFLASLNSRLKTRRRMTNEEYERSAGSLLCKHLAESISVDDQSLKETTSLRDAQSPRTPLRFDDVIDISRNPYIQSGSDIPMP
ncbi:hypothetical protein BDQ12DRAFT_679492 [Crucibulum laeve]|uniref:DUF6534 domain-containing protein n=1 Tax=Crucibulum laeve TaxID=68775 RepID=A0A5C3M7S6_9AGAR|nr:hypothetical protein BDQ12DRAFT_679492 [Crucibulum laeve]